MKLPELFTKNSDFLSKRTQYLMEKTSQVTIARELEKSFVFGKKFLFFFHNLMCRIF
jgi:hypothetical protein